jgi:threonine/homoserine/homoserine lactone efflux protein
MQGDLGLFLATAVILAVSPGPAVLYIVARSVSQGRAAGVASCAGVACGGLVHVLAATIGLSAILAASAFAFELVKYAGAAYLIWLGLRKLTGASLTLPADTAETRSTARVFGDGVIVNVLNPKTALFFLAFLPQFVSPSRGPVSLQFLLLGLVFVTIAFCTDTGWSFVASGARAWLWRHPSVVSSERYLIGSVYVGLGVAAAVSGNGRK